MSPAVGNFVQDLVEMAKATETLPIVQHENETLKADLNRAQDTIAARETAIISYKQQIDDLQAKVRSLEVERDDASFRVLEAEDKASALLYQAQTVRETAERMINLIQSPKPEPVAEPEPVQAPTGEVLQPSSPFTPIIGGESVASQTEPTPPDATQDQSESPPTPTQPIGTQSEAAGSPIEPFPAQIDDPEPFPKWSYEWYQWNDRRNERAAKAA